MYRLVDFEVKASWLKETSISLQQGKLSLEDASKIVEVRTILGEELSITLSKKQLGKIVKDNGIKLY